MQSRRLALDKRLIPGVLKIETNRMNNDNRANDANDNGNELFVNRLSEAKTQEWPRRQRECDREQQELLQERARLLWE